ncbi:MAG: hypothetical protein HN757_18260 [Calditrichaeota bacterium]|nr:hypothetical protein [Calditrichota bacterium]
MQESALNQGRIDKLDSVTKKPPQIGSDSPLGIYANSGHHDQSDLQPRGFFKNVLFLRNQAKLGLIDYLDELDETNKKSRKERFKIANYYTKSNLVRKRIKDCGRSLGTTEMWKDKKGSARVGKVETCGSQSCPICRVTVRAKRQEELKTINEGWISTRSLYQVMEYQIGEDGLFDVPDEINLPGGHLAMFTLTCRHDKSDRMKELLGFRGSAPDRRSNLKNQGIIGALYRFRRSKLWKLFKEKSGYIADVRVVETTVGDNGYHVHIHMLVYYKAEFDFKLWRDRLFGQWSISSTASGLRAPDPRRGLDIQNGNYASDYIVKWGAAAEISSPSTKEAKNGNYTIPQFERLLINEELRKESGYRIEQIEKILKEYHTTMIGRRLIQWAGKSKEIIDTYCKDYEESELKLATLNYDEVDELQALVKSRLWNKLRWNGLMSIVRTIIETKGRTGLLEFITKYYSSQLTDLITDKEELKRYSATMVRTLEKITQSKEENLK